MSEDIFLKQRHRVNAEKAIAGQYTVKDFQLEVLDRLAEMQHLTEKLQEARQRDLQRYERTLKLDAKTLVAMAAIALSVAGYVIQDARNSAKQDSEIEATRARVLHLEQIAATNTEGRIRTEVELGELRQGQAEIKAMIQAHDSATKKPTEKNGQ
jgi:hypothetical protein